MRPLLILSFLALSIVVHAQPGGGPPPDPGPAPIAGLEILLGMGGLLGVADRMGWLKKWIKK